MDYLQSDLVRLTSWLRQTIQESPSSSATGDVVEELRKLEGTLRRITAFLRDAEEREVRDESVKLWLRELKTISYQADDLLDEYQYELLRRQVEERNIAAEDEGNSTAARISGKRKSAGDDEIIKENDTASLVPPKHLLLLPDDMLAKIKKIRESFDEIDRERKALNLADLGPRRYYDHYDIKALPTSSLVDESGVFGRDDYKENLIKSLFSDMDKKLSVNPIVGMGGLGKTTLAQLVYNDSRVRQHFDKTAWVCVSTDFDVTRLTKAITESLRNGQCCDSNELDMLQRKLCDEIQDKKVLVVLDDVWSDDQTSWELLQKPFGSARMVRIIVTTREDSVARIMQQPGSYPCRPRILTEEQSWLLFKRRVFVDGGFIKETPYLVDIGKQIVQKCAGLPLAVKAIGGVLLCERDESRWWDILDSPIWDEIGTQILPVLKLSYDRMPSYLKPCFAMCSMFPKDYRIEKDWLIGLWVANGYIQGRGSKTMQDIGEDYINELHQRSVIQNAFSSDEIIMHDMVHDVALTVSEDECCAVVLDTEVDKCPEISSKVRHLFVEIHRSFSTGELMQILSWKEPIYLRTLVYIDERAVLECEDIFNKFGSLRALVLIHRGADDISFSSSSEESNFPVSYIYQKQKKLTLKHLRYLKLSTNWDMIHMKLPEFIFHFYNLQILNVSDFHGKDFTDTIGNLINLRYLKSGLFDRFPESMGDLINLQYFESGDSDCDESIDEILPQAITKLVNLRHLLYHSAFPLTLPVGIGNLTNLRTLLPSFRVGSDPERHSGIRELKTLDKLRGDLEIYDLENVTCPDDAKAANLACKPGLESLSLHWSDHSRTSTFDDDDDDELELAVHWSDHSRTSFDDDEELDLAVLENLRPHTNLKELKIYGFKGCRLPSWLGDPSFCKLTSIYLHCPQLIHDFRMLSQLTSLTSLNVYGDYSCSLVHDFQLMGSSPSLESLTINRMKCWQRWDVVVMEKDFPRLTHISISYCRNLWRLPSFQSQSLVSLKVESCDNLRVLTVHFDAASPSSLRWLDIHNCPRLEMIEGMRFLTSLETFSIRECGMLQIHVFGMLSKLPSLTSLQVCCDPPVLRNEEGMENDDFQLIASPSLKSLTINKMLCSWNNVVIEKDFPSLTSITIFNCPNLWRLPSFQSRSLVSLIVESCENLRVLTVHFDAESPPSRLGELHIEDCRSLEMIEGLSFLTSLETLYIIQCPLLQIPSHDCLPIMPRYVNICDGDHAIEGKHWCPSHGHNYNQFMTREELESSSKDEFENTPPSAGEELSISQCPLVQIPSHDRLPILPLDVDICDDEDDGTKGKYNQMHSMDKTTKETFVIFPNGMFRRSIRSWTRGGLLGRGSFGTVYEAINDDGFFFAVKEVSLLDQGSGAKKCILQLEQEISLLSQFEHENIVQYFGTEKEEAKLYIFLELVSQGSLASLYQKYRLQDSHVSAYTKQILNGLNYLHERNVVHRDIKCANILVGATGSVKLADFGLAKEITKLSGLNSCKGSWYWMAPEVVNRKGRSYGPRADIWSLGCTVLEMLTGKVPYPKLDPIQAFFEIGGGGKPPIPETLSKDARDFIQKCVQVNPDDRPTASELLEHPFIRRPLSASTSPDVSLRNGRGQSD